jgi:hypothetical protein
MKSLPLLVLGLVLALPAGAQTVTTQAPDAADSGAGTTTPAEPTPTRNIMPQTLNHKPNPTQPPEEIARSIDAFFKALHGDATAPANSQDFYERAYDTFLNSTMLGSQKEKVSYFVSKTQEAFGIYGPLKDAEVFDNYSVGSNVLVLTYLSRQTVQPLIWRFIYYRPDKTWKLINLGFGDNLYDLLD